MSIAIAFLIVLFAHYIRIIMLHKINMNLAFVPFTEEVALWNKFLCGSLLFYSVSTHMFDNIFFTVLSIQQLWEQLT